MMEFLELWSTVLLCIAAFIGFLAVIGLIARRSLKKKEEEPEKPPAHPSPPPPPPDPYTHSQYDADLHNPQVSISDMLDQMEGEIPVPPPEGGNQSPDPGVVIQSPCEDQDRGQERQEWFNKVAEDVPPVEIVPPPPMQGPIMTVKGQLVPCKCKFGGGPIYTTPPYGPPPTQFGVKSYRCDMCKDKGMIFLQHG